MRGRGLGRLINGLFEGDPFAWTCFGIFIAIGLGYVIYLVLKSKKDTSEEE